MIAEPFWQIATKLFPQTETVSDQSSPLTLYYSKTINGYVSCSVQNIKTILNRTSGEALKIWLTKKKSNKTLHTNSRVIVANSLNGIIVFNITANTVLKIVSATYEPDFLNNETSAAQALPNHIPAILASGEEDGFYYTVTELKPKTQSISWQDWPTTLTTVSPILKSLYAHTPIQATPAEHYVEEINARFQEILDSKPDYLVKPFSSIHSLFQKSIQQYPASSENLYKIFSHGDLVPNNLISTEQGVYLCDWANGGMLNAMYDLMIQNFYQPQAITWSLFSETDFINSNNEKVFFGWTSNYIDTLQEAHNISFSNADIKASLIISLAEIAIKNMARYQTEAEHDGGTPMLKNVETIYTTLTS